MNAARKAKLQIKVKKDLPGRKVQWEGLVLRVILEALVKQEQKARLGRRGKPEETPDRFSQRKNFPNVVSDCYRQ